MQKMTIQNKSQLTFGLLIAVITMIADQLSKWWMLDKLKITIRPPIEVTDFFNIVIVWNHGISFGMLAGHRVPFFLIGLALAIVAVLIRWLVKVADRSTALAIGLVIGGALGNVIDRIRFGAVADFFDFHAFGYHWPAFNIADSCIFMGVVVLCIQSIMHPQK
jgi:signal peptidase II